MKLTRRGLFAAVAAAIAGKMGRPTWPCIQAHNIMTIMRTVAARRTGPKPEAFVAAMHTALPHFARLSPHSVRGAGDGPLINMEELTAALEADATLPTEEGEYH